MRINISANELYYLGFDKQDWKEIQCRNPCNLRHIHVFIAGSNSVKDCRYLRLLTEMVELQNDNGNRTTLTIYTFKTIPDCYLGVFGIKRSKHCIIDTHIRHYVKYVNNQCFEIVKAEDYTGPFKIRTAIKVLYYKHNHSNIVKIITDYYGGDPAIMI